MFLLKLICPNIEERWVPSKRPGARGDLAMQLPLASTGDMAAEASSSTRAGTVFCPCRHAGHSSTWGCMNAQPKLVPQP